LTRYPLLHAMLTGPDEVQQLQQERKSLAMRQIGSPANRRRMTELTHQQLREELKR